MKSILVRRVERLEAESGAEDDLERARRVVGACDVVEFHPERATAEDKALAAATTKDEYMGALVLCLTQPGALVAAVEASAKMREQRSASLSMVEITKADGEE